VLHKSIDKSLQGSLRPKELISDMTALEEYIYQFQKTHQGMTVQTIDKSKAPMTPTWTGKSPA
jgi:hypothetical protein